MVLISRFQQEELTIEMVAKLRQVSEQVVHGLISQPGYRFLDETTFVEKVFNAVSQDEQCRITIQSGGDLKVRVIVIAKGIYCQSLYIGCCSQHQWEQERAYEELNRYLYRLAFNYVVIRGCSEHLAQSCTQEALHAIFQKIHTVKEPIAFLSFAITTLNRLCSQTIDKAKKQGSLEDELNNSLPTTGSFPPYLLHCLLEAIARLPNKDMRLVLTLEHFAGFDDGEIALVLGVTKNYVPQLRLRAKKMMQEDQILYTCLQNG